MALEMNRINEDLVTAATAGVRCGDPNSRSTRIFIITVFVIGNLPKAAAFVNVLGHLANILFTLCHMRKRKSNRLAETNCKSELHSGRLSLICFDARRKAI